MRCIHVNCKAMPSDVYIFAWCTLQRCVLASLMCSLIREHLHLHLHLHLQQGKARPGQARQGKARQGKARQGKARQGKGLQLLVRAHRNCWAASELERRSVAQPRTVAQLALMPGGKSSAPTISLSGWPCIQQLPLHYEIWVCCQNTSRVQA